MAETKTLAFQITGELDQRLKDVGAIGVGLLLAILALTQTGIFIPLVLTAVYAFLSIRFDDTSILDFIRYAAAFLIAKQQFYEWKM